MVTVLQVTSSTKCHLLVHNNRTLLGVENRTDEVAFGQVSAARAKMPRPVVPRHASRAIWTVIAVPLVTLVLGSGCHETRAASTDGGSGTAREFSLSTDPEVEVLRIEYFGNWRVVVSLFGDGRLALAQLNRQDVRLAASERNELLGMLVDAGLMEFDAEAFGVELAKRGRAPYAAPEGAGIGVTIRLEDYAGPFQESGPAETVVAMASPRFLQEHYPGLAEVGALVALLDEVERHRMDAPTRGRND